MGSRPWRRVRNAGIGADVENIASAAGVLSPGLERHPFPVATPEQLVFDDIAIGYQTEAQSGVELASEMQVLIDRFRQPERAQ